MKKRLFILSLLLLTGWGHVISQDARQKLDQIAGKLVKSLQASEEELVYVHRDKPWYQAGSTIWFKVYLYKRISQQASLTRNNVYVELVDEGDSIIQQLILNSVNREWDGGLSIPAKLPEGIYTLRAWTGTGNPMNGPGNTASRSWQGITNGSGLYTDQVFIVQSRQDIPAQRTPPGSSHLVGKPVARFFPEGGSLINGLDNQVAIRLADEQGMPIVSSGQVLDDANRKMADFNTDSSGWGRAVFAPYKNRSYKAAFKLADGQTFSAPLPPVQYNTAQLTVVSQDDAKLRLRVVLGDSIYGQKPASYLLGTSRGAVQFAAMGNGMFELDVPLEKFSPGLAVFHLFNEQEQELSSRTILINRKSLEIQVKGDKENYAARQKAIVNIEIKDKLGNPVSGLFSISVTDDRMVDPSFQSPAWGGWPLGPELLSFGASGGRVGRGTELADKRTGMNDAGNGNGAGTLSDTALEIRGLVLNADGNALSDQVVTLLAEGTNIVLSDTSDKEGRFVFPGMDFPDKSPFMAQVRDLQGKKQPVTVVMESLVKGTAFDAPATSNSMAPSPMPPHTPNVLASPGLMQSPALRSFRLQQADSVLTGTTPVMLEGIIVKGTKKKESKADVALKSASSRIITAEQLEKLNLGTTVNAVMMLPGVIMVGGQLTIRGGLQTTAGSASGLEPLLIIDGVPYSGGSISSTLNAINPQLIESIEVITGGEAARYGSRAANGVILLKTTNYLRSTEGADDRGMQYIFPRGYHVKPVFYAPSYEVYGVREATFTDNRSTVYWNGELAVDKQGKAQFSFFTADLSGTYTVRIVGMTSRGDLVDESVRIERR